MLAISNLTYHLGGRTLYDEASLHIKPKDKIGLIGLNGTGKSTLLRMIDGEIQPDGGEISKSKDCTIGFLNQDLLSFLTDDSILSVAMQAFGEALEVQKRIEKTLKEMETNYRDELVDKLTKAQERFEALDGYTMQAKAEEILEGIGFSTSDLQRPLREFSGGWRMRVMLAKLLLEQPSLLMLDEPTNHLDLPSIQWIENYLRTYEGAVIIVSHDRRFLDNTARSIVEVAHKKLTQYSGNYSFYLEERSLRHEIQQNAYENQQQKIRQTERFIERFRAKSTKAKQVQSRVKALDRMDMVDEVIDENISVNFKFTFSQKSGRWVSTIKNATKRYGDLTILEKSSIQLERGDKVALIGANGKGKSTLLRIIAGTEPLQEGTSEYGYNVIPAFYAQHQLESLDLKNEILEELKQSGSGKSEMELRSVLGCFLFSGDEVFKKIGVLSGGEKSRVALARTLISEANFLLLDEPTNHLDMQSVNILSQALQQYEGTFVVVSHDRQFVSEIANKIWYIEDQEIKAYPGTYEEFAVWYEKHQANKQTQAAAPKEETKPKEEKKPKPRVRDNAEEQTLKCLRKELGQVEESVMQTEEEIKLAEAEMAKPEVFEDADKLQEINTSYEAKKQELDALNERWEALAMQIEELEG